MPESEDLYQQAEIRFDTRRFAESGMDSLLGYKIDGIPLQLDQDETDNQLYASIKMYHKVYLAVKQDITRCIKKMGNKLHIPVCILS